MKIVQVTPYYPPHLGGMENVARELSERLAKKGHEVEVFTSDIGCPKDKQLKSTKNLKIHYLKAWRFANTPIIPSLFFKLLKLPKDSIIHIHTAQPLVPEIVYLVSKIKKINYISQVHIDAAPSSWIGKLLLEPYKKIFLKIFLKNSYKISALTEDYKKIIKKRYGIKDNNIKIIPNGVGEEFFTKRKAKNQTFHLLFVGRLSIQKNPERLINSIGRCKEDFILDIVGEGELKDKIINLVKEKNLKNVRFHGRKEGGKLIEFYKKSDAFILTSNEEAFPLTILEASASKLPIIVSDVKGNHEVVKNTGILVNPPTEEKFASEIDNLIKDKRLQMELSKKALNLANNHKWENIIPKWEKLYKETLIKNEIQ